MVYLDEPTTGLDPISRRGLPASTAPAAAFPLMCLAAGHPLRPVSSLTAAHVACLTLLPILPVRRHLWDLVDRCKRGRAIVLTTHSMEEADILGDRCADLGVVDGCVAPAGSLAWLACTWLLGKHTAPDRLPPTACPPAHTAFPPARCQQDWHHGPWPPALHRQLHPP